MIDPKAAHERANTNYVIVKAKRDAAWAVFVLAEEEHRLASREVDRTYNELLKHEEASVS